MSDQLSFRAANLLRRESERGRSVAVGSYVTGQRVPASGIYEVRHRQHRVPHEVTLLKDQLFPPCAKCGTAVQFKVIRVAEAIDKLREKIVLNVLPVIDDESEQAA